MDFLSDVAGYGMTRIESNVFEVCVFRLISRRPEYLLLRRSQDDVLYPGIWQVVTGTVEPEENVQAAARREIKEETGLVPKRMWVVPRVNTFYSASKNAVCLSPFFAAEVEAEGGISLSSEHIEFQWSTIEDVVQMIPFPSQAECVELIDKFVRSGETYPIFQQIVL